MTFVTKKFARTGSVAITALLLSSSFMCLPAQAAEGSSFIQETTTTTATPAPVKYKVGDTIGKLYVPRYGKKYVRTILEGTTSKVLYNKAGLGHYVDTQMIGHEGNFAIAGHRHANGGPMLKIDKLKTGDMAYVLTKTSWFTFKWVGTKVVKPNNVGVIYPVPVGLASAKVGGKYMTFTSCTPIYVNTKRIAAWFELVSETPKADGMPADLAKFLGK